MEFTMQVRSAREPVIHTQFSHFTTIFLLENGIYDSVIEREAILDEHFPRKILHGLMLRVVHLLTLQ